MNEQLLTWIVPGFAGFFAYQNSRKFIPVHRGSWDFVIYLGVFSVLSTKITENVFSFTEDQGVSLLFIVTASAVAALLGLVLSFVFNLLVRGAKIPNPTDNFSQECYRAWGRPVLVVLKNKKIYGGFLNTYDTAPRDLSNGEKSISITPFYSASYDKGKRSEEKIYNKDELKGKVQQIILFSREIESFRIFDQTLFDHFVSNGDSKS